MGERCSATVYSRDAWLRGHPCAKPAKVERDGKWYCGVHDPAAKAERDAKRRAAWVAKDNVSKSAIAQHAKAAGAIADQLGWDTDDVAVLLSFMSYPAEAVGVQINSHVLRKHGLLDD